MADIKKNANRVRGKLKVRKFLAIFINLLIKNLLNRRISNKVLSMKSNRSQQVLIYEYVKHSTRLYRGNSSRL